MGTEEAVSLTDPAGDPCIDDAWVGDVEMAGTADEEDVGDTEEHDEGTAAPVDTAAPVGTAAGAAPRILVGFAAAVDDYVAEDSWIGDALGATTDEHGEEHDEEDVGTAAGAVVVEEEVGATATVGTAAGAVDAEDDEDADVRAAAAGLASYLNEVRRRNRHAASLCL